MGGQFQPPCDGQGNPGAFLPLRAGSGIHLKDSAGRDILIHGFFQFDAEAFLFQDLLCLRYGHAVDIRHFNLRRRAVEIVQAAQEKDQEHGQDARQDLLQARMARQKACLLFSPCR